MEVLDRLLSALSLGPHPRLLLVTSPLKDEAKATAVTSAAGPHLPRWIGDEATGAGDTACAAARHMDVGE